MSAVVEAQAVVRRNEYCEVCGAKNPFRKGSCGTSSVDDDGNRVIRGECRNCGAPVTIYWLDGD